MMWQFDDGSLKETPLLFSSNNSATNGLQNADNNHIEFDTNLGTKSNSKISFAGLSYTVKINEHCCHKKELHILEDLSGIFYSGINAILGSTGSGKTTLLDILAGRKSKENVSGSIYLNDKVYPKNFKFLSGYVIQDDVVMGMLSVRENIEFSANLRLSSKISKNVKDAKIQSLIEDLGLTKCANTRVGTQLMRGISGGERKRTAIAMELISSPQILFLDEPTTGLDSSTAQSLILMLKKLSSRGITVIISIHQPRYSIFKLFDCLFLLASGRCVYHGDCKDSLKFFNQAGFSCEDHDNPSDFFLDVLSGGIVSTAQTESHFDKENQNIDTTLNEVLINTEGIEKNLADERHRIISNHYKQSKYHHE